jgi:tetratricopeptide (TPR) repeat protein
MHLPIGPRTLPEGSLTIADVYGYYAQGLLRTGEYFADNYKDNNLALDFYNRAALLDPGNYSVYQALGVYYIQNGNCSLAKDNFQQAVDIAPYQNLVYFLLYYDYQDCLKQPQKAQQVVLDYQRNFQTDFFQDLKKIGDIK